jgi:cytochrome c553
MNKTAYILLAALFLAACGRDQEAPVRPEAAAAQADAAAGRVLAEAKCINCHGLDGRGTEPLIPHLAGQRLEYLQLALREYRSGERPHAALQQLFSELSETDLNNVAAFYAGLPAITPTGAASQPAPADALAASRAAATACAACHGADGNATMPGMPSLAGQHRDYLIAAMQAYKDETRKHAVMSAQMSAVDALTLQNLATFYAAQPARAQDRKASGDVVAGERLSAGCGGCHGLQGHTLDARTPALAGQDPQYLVASMKAYRNGSRKHEEMKALLVPMSETQLQHVAAFYAAQTPRQDRAPTTLSAREWAERCDRCHGPGAENPAMVVPRIEGQQREYLAHVLRDYRDGRRHQSAMHAMGMPLTDTDIQAIAEHYATLMPR